MVLDDVPEQPARQEIPSARLHILLVEDDLRLSRALKRALEEEMHTVRVVGDGPAALERVAESEYDVIVLDLMLPTIDGLEVCREMRATGVRTPILILSARGDVLDRVSGLDAGADDYLAKPFALPELLARLRALTRRSARGIESLPKLQVGDLTLDPTIHCAIRGDKEIYLTVKEFLLLELLMRHKGQVLRRSQILDHVWDFDTELTSNVVDTYMHYLRRKIDKGFDQQLIQTIRGVGYRLRA